MFFNVPYIREIRVMPLTMNERLGRRVVPRFFAVPSQKAFFIFWNIGFI